MMNETITDMRWFRGKQLLALLRGGDYAHAGEEQAILQLMSKFPKDQDQTILDVGCGQGGTANFIQSGGWGKVTGVDIEVQSIDYAKKKYPRVEFFASDVMDIHNNLSGHHYDIIYLFNVFYAFSDQMAALKALRNLAKPTTKLAIFDYTDLCDEGMTNPMLDLSNKQAVMIPIKEEKLLEMLQQSQWKLDEKQELNEEYKKWYAELLNKLKHYESTIISEFGQADYDTAYKCYTAIYQALENKTLGGAIFYISIGSIGVPGSYCTST